MGKTPITAKEQKDNRDLAKLVGGLATSIAVGMALLYGIAAISHAYASRTAYAAYDRWQSKVACANLIGDTPEQVEAYLDKQGTTYKGDIGDLGTGGFVFATVGPVATSLESAWTDPKLESWRIDITFRFDAKRRLTAHYTCYGQ